MSERPYAEILSRIQKALETAALLISPLSFPGAVKVRYKSGKGPVTEADHRANRVLRELLVRDQDGWLSEESADDLSRLERTRVWVVDPLDGTREFVAGVPEWCISVALIENGRAVAGGICNPAKNELFLGAVGQGISRNHQSVRTSQRTTLSGALVLASRAELRRGEWVDVMAAPFRTQPVGSVAYKLALVAAGLADATWTLSPKNEWDVAAGVALVEAAGGFVRVKGGRPLIFNRRSTVLPGLLACGPHMGVEVSKYVQVLNSRAPSRSFAG